MTTGFARDIRKSLRDCSGRIDRLEAIVCQIIEDHEESFGRDGVGEGIDLP
ncbi:hypothetical protein ACRQ1B_18185 [Rhizobium panacihumi]|uniref:hypothetical protein n=1 Tax=Rhizobium panacihumi TaxID=2008450 RepID=UPI003D78DA3B